MGYYNIACKKHHGSLHNLVGPIPCQCTLLRRSRYDTVPTFAPARNNETPLRPSVQRFTSLIGHLPLYLQSPLNPSSSYSCLATGRSALDSRGGIGLSQVLDIALLAVL